MACAPRTNYSVYTTKGRTQGRRVGGSEVERERDTETEGERRSGRERGIHVSMKCLASLLTDNSSLQVHDILVVGLSRWYERERRNIYHWAREG